MESNYSNAFIRSQISIIDSLTHSNLNKKKKNHDNINKRAKFYFYQMYKQNKLSQRLEIMVDNFLNTFTFLFSW